MLIARTAHELYATNPSSRLSDKQQPTRRNAARGYKPAEKARNCRHVLNLRTSSAREHHAYAAVSANGCKIDAPLSRAGGEGGLHKRLLERIVGRDCHLIAVIV